jgi:hypothetical protein
VLDSFEPNGWHIVSIILGLMGMGWLALMEEHLKDSILVKINSFKDSILEKTILSAILGHYQEFILDIIIQYQDAALGTFVLLPIHLHRSHFERRQSYLVSVFV